ASCHTVWHDLRAVRGLDAVSTPVRSPAARRRGSVTLARTQTNRAEHIMGSLHEAARAGDLIALRRLLDAGDAIEARDEQGQTPLMAAAEAGQVGSLQALIADGAELDGAAEPCDPDPKDPPSETDGSLVVRYGLIERIGPIVRGEVTVKQKRQDRRG